MSVVLGCRRQSEGVGGVGGRGGEHAITIFVSHDGRGENSLNSFEREGQWKEELLARK